MPPKLDSPLPAKSKIPASRPRGESLLLASPRPSTEPTTTIGATQAPATVPPTTVAEPNAASPPPRAAKVLPPKQLPPPSAMPSKAPQPAGVALPVKTLPNHQPARNGSPHPVVSAGPAAKSLPRLSSPPPTKTMPPAGPSSPGSKVPPGAFKVMPKPAYKAQPVAAPKEADDDDDDDDDFLRDFTDPNTPLPQAVANKSSWEVAAAENRYDDEGYAADAGYLDVIRALRERVDTLEVALQRSERDREAVYRRLDATIDALAMANEERIALLYGGPLHDNGDKAGTNRSPRLVTQRGIPVKPPLVLPKARPSTPPPATTVVAKFVPPSSASAGRADPSPIRVMSLSEPLEIDKTPRERRCVIGVFQITGVNFALYEFARKSSYPAVAEFERFLRDDVVTMVSEAVPHAAETLLTSIAVGAGQVRTIHVAYPATSTFNPELRPLISDADWPLRVDVTVRGFTTEEDVTTVAARMEAYSRLTSALRGAMVFGKLSFSQVLSEGVKEPRVDNASCSVTIVGEALDRGVVKPTSSFRSDSQPQPAAKSSVSVQPEISDSPTRRATADASSMTAASEAPESEIRVVQRAEHMIVSQKPVIAAPSEAEVVETRAKKQPVSTLVKVAVCFKTLLFSRYSHDAPLRRDVLDAFVNDLRDGGADEQDWLAVDASFGALNVGVGSLLSVTLCATSALGSYTERGQAAEALAQLLRSYLLKHPFSRVNGVNQMHITRGGNRLEVVPLVVDLTRTMVNGVALADREAPPNRPDATHASSPPPRHAASAPGSATRGPVELRTASVEFIDIDTVSPHGQNTRQQATPNSQYSRRSDVSDNRRSTVSTSNAYNASPTSGPGHSTSQRQSQQQRNASFTPQGRPVAPRRRPEPSRAPDVTVRLTYVVPAFDYERFVESNSRLIEDSIEADARDLAAPFVASPDAVRVYFSDGASSSRNDYPEALTVVIDNDMLREDVAEYTAAVDQHFADLHTLGALRRFVVLGEHECMVPRGGWSCSSYYVDNDQQQSNNRNDEAAFSNPTVTVVATLDEAEWSQYDQACRRDATLDDALHRAAARDFFDALGSGTVISESDILVDVVMKQSRVAIKAAISLPSGVSKDFITSRLKSYFGQESALLKAKLLLVRHLDVDIRYGVSPSSVSFADS